MSELKLYEVSEEYISYISTVEKNVFVIVSPYI